VYGNVAEYLDLRCFNSGSYFSLALARYALDIYPTDEELQNKLLVTAERLGEWIVVQFTS
jgi:hypothetical protein